MKDIREILNISYFDNKELNLKEHCNIYSNIKKDLISILNKYDIKYVVADTELIRDLSKENQELKKQLEDKENQQKEFIEWLENEIKERQIEIVSYHPSSQILIEQIIDIKKMILPKYKEIVGLKKVNND